LIEESARIARGDVLDISKLDANNYDALIIPGGFGAAKNLSNFAFKGDDREVDKDVCKILKDFHSHQKVIGMTCISPVLAAKVFAGVPLAMTLGGVTGKNWPYAGAS
jgi:enhancing lycopene biosynthesis protein 2